MCFQHLCLVSVYERVGGTNQKTKDEGRRSKDNKRKNQRKNFTDLKQPDGAVEAKNIFIHEKLIVSCLSQLS